MVFDNLVYGHKWAVKWGTFVEGDLADPALVARDQGAQRDLGHPFCRLRLRR